MHPAAAGTYVDESVDVELRKKLGSAGLAI
jgi:hypothetical protein